MTAAIVEMKLDEYKRRENELLALRARVAKLKSLLEECAENFEMWHEAKNILAKIDAVLKDEPQ